METQDVQRPLYKVLNERNRSCHGGRFDWWKYLPTKSADGWEPGTLTPAVMDVLICSAGYHLTTQPMRWAVRGMQVYVAEGFGRQDPEADKTAFAQVRLVRPAPEVVPRVWHDVEQLLDDLATIRWLSPRGQAASDWEVRETRRQAEMALGDEGGRFLDREINLLYDRMVAQPDWDIDPIKMAMFNIAANQAAKLVPSGYVHLVTLAQLLIARALDMGPTDAQGEQFARYYRPWREGWGVAGINRYGRLVVYRRP